MKNIGKVANGCLSCFMIGTYGYNSLRKTKGPRGGPLQFDAALLAVCINREEDGP